MSWYPDLAEDVLKSLFAQICPALMLFVEAAGYLPDCDLILMQFAYCLEPLRPQPERLIASMPYTNPEIFLECMNAAVQRALLYQDGCKFGLTEPGREIVEGLNELCDRLYAKIDMLSSPELVRLRYFSGCVIDEIRQPSEPAERLAFQLNLLFKCGVDRPLIVQLRKQMFSVLAFREDAYVAAWRPYESDGKLWDAFTLIWRGQAATAAELQEF